MADLDHFDQIPLHFDPQRKVVSSSSAAAATGALADELDSLNQLHRAFVTSVESPSGAPPPPLPVNPRRAAQVVKLGDSAAVELRKGRPAEAERLYDLAYQMARGRPPWEPAQLFCDETARILSNRAQARMGRRDWGGGAVDAETSVEARRIGNAKAWWRRGKCLMEMGRLAEAREWVQRSLEIENDKDELVALGREIEGKLARQKEGRKVAGGG